MNIDENTMQNIKNMVDNGNISEAISNISPEMIQNFSKLLSNQQSSNTQQNNKQENNNPYNNNQMNNDFSSHQSNINNNTNNAQYSNHNENTTNSNNNFDFSSIDMNTIMKMTSVLGKMNNNQNDPRANLLNSLKPYLRDNKKGKLDNYMNLLNVSKIAEIMKETNKENNNNV